MGLSVASHKPCPVNRENHMQVLNADIVKNLIVGPLQEGGIHCHHRLQASGRQPGRKGYRMLLCDSHIKETIRKHILKPFEACSVRHGRSDRHHLLIPIPELAHHRREDIGIIGLRPLMLRQSRLDLKGLRAMKAGRMPLCRSVSLSLSGTDMNQNRMADLFRIPEGAYQLLDVVPVYRSQIGNSHVFKIHAGNHQLL